MATSEVTTRRRVAVLDGAGRHELALAPHVTLADAVRSLGIELEEGRRLLVGPGGIEVPADRRAADLADGAVLALVDLTERVERTPGVGERRRDEDDAPTASVWWILAGAGGLLATVALAAPGAIDATLRVALTLIAAGGAVASATVWSRRAGAAAGAAGRLGAAAAFGPLALAFGAGVVAVPPLPAATGILAVFTGLCVAAVLAGLLAVVARLGIVRAELGTVTLILLALAAVWGLALALDLPAFAPASVALGAVPVALRALPTTLIDVAPGTFIEYRRFQTSRWAVRQQLPAEVGPIESAAAHDLVGRASARLRGGTALLSIVAAVTAPFALPEFDPAAPLVFAGRIALATCVVLALLLGARRSSAPALHWMPRAAALVVAAVALVGALRAAGPLFLTVLAGAALLLGVAIAAAIVPMGRGARSLVWSRVGDVFEWLAVVLALPAGLLAADTIGVLRGVMGG